MNIKRFAATVMVLMLGGLLFMGTKTNVGGSAVTVTGWGSYFITNVKNMTGTTDTLVTAPFRITKPESPADTSMLDCALKITTADGDSAKLAVRFQVSLDGTVWKSTTVGTDGTSWDATATGTSYDLLTFVINPTIQGGYWPYSRFMICGTAGTTAYAAGLKVQVLWTERKK